tara:strand:+ start:1146 stop:1274 length:129 start_codon:yes stop_codon:yes gene_type:complete
MRGIGEVRWGEVGWKRRNGEGERGIWGDDFLWEERARQRDGD